MKRTLAIVVPILILTATAWYFCLYASPLEISPETTYITAPLMSDGKRIDYFRAWEERAYPPEMKTDDNGYRILVRAIGDPVEYYTSEWDHVEGGIIRHDLDSEPFRLQVYEKLGLDPTILPTMTIECPFAFMGRYIEEHPEAYEQWWRGGDHLRIGGRPWTLDDFPQFKGWLAENEAGLNLLGEAVRKPVFRAPNISKNFMCDWNGFRHAQVFRNFARALQARAMYRTGVGNIDGAIDDVITGYLLARHVSKHGTRVDYLVGIAIEGMAASIHFGANPAAPPSREQLQRLFDAIRALPPLPTLEDLLVVERLQALRVLQEYAFGEKPDVFHVPEYGPWAVDVDWNFIFWEVNKAFDAIIAGKETSETIVQRWTEDILTEEERRLPELLVRATAQERTKVALAVLGGRLFTSALTQATRYADTRRQCAENLKLLTLALLLYEKDHGKLPDGDWREAIRPYLGENAEKYFRCPSHPGLAEGETTYAMIRRESGVTPNTPHTLLLVEVFPPMKMTGNDGTILESQAIYRWREGERPAQGVGSEHPGGFNISYRSGAVRLVSTSASTAQWKALMEGTLADGLW